MTTADKTRLRKQLRERRRALSHDQQRCAARNLEQRVSRLPCFRRAQCIAFYLPNDGEVVPTPLLRRAARMGKHCYLPVLNGAALHFHRYRPGQTLKRNRYGIPEPPPRRGSRRLPAALDIIFLPLVGFDTRGNRLGMGGGFYDRTLRRPRRGRRPLLIGLAHECQRLSRLPSQPWDIPLDAIATDRSIFWINGRRGTT